MNDFNRNTRTLIVSFVIAIMALVPLRFVEVGQYAVENPQVLGEKVILEPQIVLPSAELTEESLEMPYREIDGLVLGEQEEVASNDCFNEGQMAAIHSELEEKLGRVGITEDEVVEIVTWLDLLEKKRCR